MCSSCVRETTAEEQDFLSEKKSYLSCSIMGYRRPYTDANGAYLMSSYVELTDIIVMALLICCLEYMPRLCAIQ